MQRISLLAMALGLAALHAQPAASAPHQPRHWTLDDILTVPVEMNVALSSDRRHILVAANAADLGRNLNRWTIEIYEVRTGRKKVSFQVDHFLQLEAIPYSSNWSALIADGSGQELVEITPDGRRTIIASQSQLVEVGLKDNAVQSWEARRPRMIGILGYNWSPDGRWLYFSALQPKSEQNPVRFDEDVTRRRSLNRSTAEAEIALFIKTSGREARQIATLASNDRAAFYYGGEIWWEGRYLHFFESSESRPVQYERRTYDLKLGKLIEDQKTAAGPIFHHSLGLKGGRLMSSGHGDKVELVEQFAGSPTISYGLQDFTVGDPRSAGVHHARDRKSLIVGTRKLHTLNYGLALLKNDKVREIGGSASYTKCSFSDDLELGVCIREGMSRPPELVKIETGSDKVTPIASISPRHDEIAPLSAEQRLWRNRNGQLVSGYIIYPRNYMLGSRYPAILVTHGSDADDRFANIGMQWEYPVQLFAEQGYVVLLINDPSPRQSKDISAAYDAWSRLRNDVPPATVRQHIWMDGAWSFEDAVRELAADGLIDINRVGIAGFSRGSQMVNVSLTQTQLYRAASGGDGSYLEPSLYPDLAHSYQAIYGGPPYGSAAGAYREFAPSLNADKACTPLLQQIVRPRGGAIDLHEAFRAEAIPSQLTLYPGETATSEESHVFYIPSNRRLAQLENLAWFNYWLRDRRDPDMVFPERLATWDKMAKEAGRPQCEASPIK